MHTRLPWHHSRKSVYVSDINHTCIAQMLRGQEVNEANADLIVKAVNSFDDMLEYIESSASAGCATAQHLLKKHALSRVEGK